MRIRGTRYKVVHLAAEYFHYGWSAEELLRQHPDLRPGEVYSALAYFYDHRDELLNAIRSLPDIPPQLQGPSSLTRAELLARRAESS